MVGNTVRSDVLPVLAIGGRAVHVPYEVTWSLEHADHDGDVPTLSLGRRAARLARASRSGAHADRCRLLVA